jgi:hypothetical protein
MDLRAFGMGEMTVFCRASLQRSADLFVSRALKTAAVLLGALLLASCAGTPGPAVGIAGDPYEIAEVDVVIAKNVSYGADMIDGSSPQEYAKKLQVALKQRLSAELVQPKSGKKPAKLEVVLDRVSLSSGIGRALLKTESQIGGYVTLSDKRSKAIIARLDQLYVDDDSLRVYGGGSGGAGAILAMGALAANVVQSGDDTRINSVVDPFTKQVKAWLGKP